MCSEKVDKDEREHAEKEAKKRNLRLDAEFENRLGSLKAKKRRRYDCELCMFARLMTPANSGMMRQQRTDLCSVALS